MSGSDSDFSPRSEEDEGGDQYSPESLFPGDNEIFNSSTAWGTKEYQLWSYFFKIVSNSGEDYHSKFVSRVKASTDGKINWDFWINPAAAAAASDVAPEKSVVLDNYETAIQLLIERVASGEFVFGRDYAQKLAQLVKDVIAHREIHLKKSPPARYGSHRPALELWTKFQVVLSKVKTGPSMLDWLIMVVIAGIGVYLYYLYASITRAQ